MNNPQNQKISQIQQQLKDAKKEEEEMEKERYYILINT